MSNSTDNTVATVAAPSDKRASRFNAFYFGAFIAMVVACVKCLLGVTAVFVGSVVPYLAGVGMFVALIAVFGAIIATLKSVRKHNKKQVAILDCYIAVAVIGVLGYFLAACVATFQAGADPSQFWTAGMVAAASFAGFFVGGKYGAECFKEGKNAK